MNMPLPPEKKLTVLYRVEPGCLGPQGKEYIEGFCEFALSAIEHMDGEFIHWILVPRYDKSLPEMQYQINGKKLSHDKAEKYLQLFDKHLEEFEGHLYEKLADLIDEYMRG